MTDPTQDVSYLIFEHLRYMRGKLDTMAFDMVDVKVRLGSVEVSVAGLHGDVAHLSVKMDHFDARLGRIERRLDLIDAP